MPAPAMSFKMTGIEAMIQRLARMKLQFDDDVVIAIREEAEVIIRRAKQEFVPIDDSALKGSGFVNDVVRKGKDVSVDMGFGGAASAYALTVHETPSSADPRSWKGKSVSFKKGGPKYLERPLMEAVQGMDVRIARKVAPR